MGEVFEYYSAVNKKDVEWLWYPYIASGKITILQGDPGEGKSTVAVHLSALLSTAGKLPDGTKVEHPVNVIYQCSEDGIADTIKPRLEKADADCSRLLYIIEEMKGLTLEDERIEETIAATHAKLLIIDPLQAYLGNDMDILNAVRMRNILRNLAKIAEKYGCAILLICHLNKASGHKTLYRSLGSIDIAAVARSVLMIVRDKDDPQMRYMFQIKNNLAEEGPPIGFRIGCDGFRWMGKCNRKFEEVFSGVPEKLTKRKRAAREIRSSLRESDIAGAQMYKILQGLGISRRTAELAKEDVGAISYRKNNIWYWHLEEK